MHLYPTMHIHLIAVLVGTIHVMMTTVLKDTMCATVHLIALMAGMKLIVVSAIGWSVHTKVLATV